MGARGRRPDDRPWALYSRLSKLMDGSDYKIETQEETSLQYAEENDLPTSDEHMYSDNMSAWKRNGKRPDWDRMMEAARAGKLGGIIVPALDRFTRKPRDVEDLIDIAEQHGLRIAGPRTGDVNLNTPQGRQNARGAGNHAATESDLISARTKTRLAQIMANGKPVGGAGRVFGFEVGGQVQRPDEVAVVREIARRFLDGEELQKLADDLNERGILRPMGKPWKYSDITRMLSLHRYGGHVTHTRAEDPDRPREKTLAFVGRIPDEFGPPVFDEDTYLDVQAELKSRRRGRKATPLFLLTGIAKCDRCERKRTMSGGRRSKRNGVRLREYRCAVEKGGCAMSVLAEPVEDMVEWYMIHKVMVNRHRNDQLSEAEDKLNDERARLNDQLDKVRQRRKILAAKFQEGELDEEEFDSALTRFGQQQSKVMEALAKLPTVPRVNTVPYGPTEWEALDVDAKRAAIRRYRVNVTIKPQTNMRNVFDPERVHISMDPVSELTPADRDAIAHIRGKAQEAAVQSRRAEGLS